MEAGTARSPAPEAGHVGFRPRFVDEDESGGIGPGLLPSPFLAGGGDVLALLFACAVRLFKSDAYPPEGVVDGLYGAGEAYAVAQICEGYVRASLRRVPAALPRRRQGSCACPCSWRSAGRASLCRILLCFRVHEPGFLTGEGLALVLLPSLPSGRARLPLQAGDFLATPAILGTLRDHLVTGPKADAVLRLSGVPMDGAEGALRGWAWPSRNKALPSGVF